MDTDKPQAGRDLDALIAEKVMGWHHDPDWEDCASFRSWWFDNPEMTGDALFLNRFSTDLVAAVDVIRSVMNILAQPGPRGGFRSAMVELRESAWIRDTRAPDVHHGLWHCRFTREYSYKANKVWWGSADSAPLAICRAALETAQGGQDE